MLEELNINSTHTQLLRELITAGRDTRSEHATGFTLQFHFQLTEGAV